MGSGGSKHKQQGSRAYGQYTERPSPPGKPYLLPGAQPDPEVIVIRWEPPIFNGGSKITGYLVEHKRTGSPHWVKATPLILKHTQLSLSGLEPGMRYQFRVWAENIYGRSDHSELSEPLAISYGRSGVSIAPVFTQGLTDTTGIEDEKVEFLVKVEGTPLPRISWYKDGFEVFSNRRQRVSTDADISSFVIHQADLTDEGEIKCSATNKAGHAVTKARLTLEAPPSIRLPRQYEDGLLFELGEVMRLKVLVIGRPQPIVTWFHNGEAVKPSSRIDLATTDRYALLRVTEATREDRGEYQVKAKNKIGDDIASFLVTITDRPLPPGKVNVVMTLGRCVTLAWTAPNDDGGCKIGNYIVEYYRIGWDMWLKAATCRQLTTTIGDLIEGSEYKFRVKAENPYGISDPSDDSNVVFIPDPKRGLLEPPPKGTTVDHVPEQWMEMRKKQTEKKIKPQLKIPPKKQGFQWEEEESPIPSPVVLANQVLRKVKLAPQRTWSEDSQGSPPREPSPKPAPVPPKRKHKPSTTPPDMTQKMKRISEEEEIWKKDGQNWDWDDENEGNFGQPSMRDELHSSSEMMLVLVGNSRAATEERDFESRLTAEELKDATYIAPPMSLSAPVIGVCEQISQQELRPWGSSSQLMYEMALARFNKEIDEEETEIKVKRRYGVERKRSFEQRGSKTREEILSELKERTVSMENIKETLKIKDEPPIIQDNNDDENERKKYDKFSERFMNLEKSFKDYSVKYDYDEAPMSDLDSMERSFDYTEDEVEEETYHPRLGKGTFTPIALEIPNKTDNNINKIKETVQVNIEKSPSPVPIPTITLNEHSNDINLEKTKNKTSIQKKIPSPQNDQRYEKSPSPEIKSVLNERREKSPSPKQRYSVPNKKIERISRKETPVREQRHTMPPVEEYRRNDFRDVRSRTPSPTKVNTPKIYITTPNKQPQNNLTEPVILRKRSPSPKIIQQEKPASPSKLPKPILKVRDQSLDRSELSDSEHSHSKKVRIEVPEDKQNIDRFAQEENDIGLFAGEVARNRRRPKSQNLEERDDSNVVVSHYSDIVREFGHPKKPVTKLYLSYEELKAAADKVQEQMSNQTDFETMEKQQQQQQQQQQASKESQECKELILLEQTPNLQRTKKKNLFVAYLLDLSLFLIACWLYIFKDSRLVIPILILMIYRQLSDSLQRKLTFRRTKKEE